MFDATSPSRLPRLVKLFTHAFGFSLTFFLLMFFLDILLEIKIEKITKNLQIIN